MRRSPAGSRSARQSGVPEEPLRRYAAERRDHDSGIAAVIEPDRALLPGVSIATDLGSWTVHETPGHAPSHVCLFQPERRLLISGDHLLGRISLFFDYGYSPDPVGEFVNSLDVVERLGARLCLPGHGRTFADVHAHIEGNRTLVAERIERVLAAIAGEPRTAFEVVPEVIDDVPLSRTRPRGCSRRRSPSSCTWRAPDARGGSRASRRRGRRSQAGIGERRPAPASSR